MKGKRYTTEDKIRILGEADRGKKIIQELCREENISGGELPSVEAAVWADGPQPRRVDSKSCRGKAEVRG